MRRGRAATSSAPTRPRPAIGGAAALAGDLTVPGDRRATRRRGGRRARRARHLRRQHRRRHARRDPRHRRRRRRGAYHSMLRPALEVARAAAPHLAAGGRGRLVFLTARSRRRGDARPRPVVGDAQRRRRRRPLAGASSWRPTCSSTSSSPASSTRRRWAASRRPRRRPTARSPTTCAPSTSPTIPLGRLGHAPRSSPTSWRSCARRGRRSSPARSMRVDGGAVRGF